MNKDIESRRASFWGNVLAFGVLGGSFSLGCLGVYLAIHYNDGNWLALWILFFALVMAG